MSVPWQTRLLRLLRDVAALEVAVVVQQQAVSREIPDLAVLFRTLVATCKAPHLALSAVDFARVLATLHWFPSADAVGRLFARYDTRDTGVVDYGTFLSHWAVPATDDVDGGPRRSKPLAADMLSEISAVWLKEMEADLQLRIALQQLLPRVQQREQLATYVGM